MNLRNQIFTKTRPNKETLCLYCFDKTFCLANQFTHSNPETLVTLKRMNLTNVNIASSRSSILQMTEVEDCMIRFNKSNVVSRRLYSYRQRYESSQWPKVVVDTIF